ncbi:hypothetical protein PVAP13_5NG642666 [Panicum virgatum]|uniref:Uncharacterized protein n=1 Tax=Panicum virgatum TaxID=38727 RepID=A0A8T0SBD1_PANVG|nr:hypothetical protein PVAP13_5NG642666 [Panicum virgatum]
MLMPFLLLTPHRHGRCAGTSASTNRSQTLTVGRRRLILVERYLQGDYHVQANTYQLPLNVQAINNKQVVLAPYGVELSRPEQKLKFITECQAADAVVLTYACDRPATLERLSLFWLPEQQRLQLKTPVIVVGVQTGPKRRAAG